MQLLTNPILSLESPSWIYHHHLTSFTISPLFDTNADYHTAQNTLITVKWAEGVDATDWESVAKKENLDTIHTEMLRLEESVHTIHLELQHIRRKEEQMRDVNGTLYNTSQK